MKKIVFLKQQKSIVCLKKAFKNITFKKTQVILKQY